MNPQFFINLSDPDPYDEEMYCPVVVSLAQKQRKRKSEHAIGFKVYKCDLQDRHLSEQFMRRNNSVRQNEITILRLCHDPLSFFPDRPHRHLY